MLDILKRHAGDRIRAMGSRHSWSEVAACDGVTLDMRALDRVEPYTEGADHFVRVGAGCRLQRLLDRLHAESDRTLPTLGAIKRQTISGAIATGTHGSGRQGLSHFVVGVRVAAYDANDGEPEIFEHRSGDALKAARCALGCMGVVLSVDLRTVQKYKVEETLVRGDGLGNLRARYEEFPLTQFLLVPYRWKYLFYERTAVADRKLTLRECIRAWLFRLHNFLWVDCLAHALLKLCLLAGRRAQRWFLDRASAGTLTGVWRIDDAEHVLTLGHHYFRHEEMELFVPESRLAQAVDLLRHATAVFAGERADAPEALAGKLRAAGLYDELAASQGQYTHHYPFAFRRVPPEDALISMVSSTHEPWYSISVFTYHAPRRRAHYYAFCSWLARAMHALFEARLHWGKHFPLAAAHAGRSYPDLETFKNLCRATDPRGAFRNAFSKRALDF